MSETPKADWSELHDPNIRKFFFVGFLILILLVPIGWIRDLVAEREGRQAGVKNELTATWGGSQTFVGPLLVVPYLEHWKTDKGEEKTRTCAAWFLPETLAVDGGVEPERRSRGIFDVILYRTHLAISGTFARPDFSAWRIDEADVVWDGARLAIGITDLRGIEGDPKAHWDEKPLAFAPASMLRCACQCALRRATDARPSYFPARVRQNSPTRQNRPRGTARASQGHVLAPLPTLPVPRLRVLVPEIAPAAVRHHGRVGLVRDAAAENRPAEPSHHDRHWVVVDPAAHYGWAEAPRLGTLVDVYG